MNRARRRQVRRAFQGGWDPVNHNLMNERAWRRYTRAVRAFRTAMALFQAGIIANYTAIAHAIDRTQQIDADAKEMAASYHLEPNLEPLLTRKDHQ